MCTEPPLLTVLCGALLAAWAYTAKARKEAWLTGRLEFEGSEEPEVYTPGIERD